MVARPDITIGADVLMLLVRREGCSRHSCRGRGHSCRGRVVIVVEGRKWGRAPESAQPVTFTARYDKEEVQAIEQDKAIMAGTAPQTSERHERRTLQTLAKLVLEQLNLGRGQSIALPGAVARWLTPAWT